MEYSWLAWMVIAYCFSITGDILVKKDWLWLGALVYASSTPFWAQVLRSKDLSYVTIVSAVIGNIMLLVAASLFLGDNLTPRQWLGFTIGLVAVILMDR